MNKQVIIITIQREENGLLRLNFDRKNVDVLDAIAVCEIFKAELIEEVKQHTSETKSR